ncbi:MAG: PEP-CTERM sorting domain-containing protein [Phycisphaerales bacterium]
MKNLIVSMVAVAGIAGIASAQVEANAGRLTFQVYNPATSSWGSSIDAAPGQQVEVRVVASYVGTRTDLFAMGEVLYQPTFSNADNTGAGAQADQIGAWRNGGASGNSVANSMLTEAEGNQGTALADYGRVRFGGTATAATGSNLMTSFRHNSDNGSPAGSWIRIAGNFVTSWPGAIPTTTDAAHINSILRGISSMQQSQALAPTFHVVGTTNVIFRQAIILSDDATARSLQFSSFIESARRVGGTTSTDDTRYMSWQTGSADSGTYRTGVTYVPATINVVPTPASMALLGLGGLVAARRRRA